MKSKQDEISQRYLLLFKIDAKNLFERITTRKKEYIELFALKRTRRHFKEIFFSRYNSATIHDLAHCPVEVLESLDLFHHQVDELFWYLTHTEDMPNTIEDEIQRKSNQLERAFETLSLYIDAELSGENALSVEQDFYDEQEAENLIPMEEHPLFSEEEFEEEFIIEDNENNE